MAKQKSNMFKGRTARSMERPKNNYGYLNLPDDVDVFKPEGATNVIFDIVPYTVTDPHHLDNKKYKEDAVVGELWWKKPIKVHKDIGPDSVSIVCPTTIGERCPICAYGSKRRKAGAEWDELKDIFPKNRSLYLIVPADTSECEVDYTEGVVHVMDQSDFTFGEILAEEVKKDVDFEGFPDPYDGLSLEVYFRKKKFGRYYFAEASKIDFLERDQQYDKEFLEELPSLDDMIKILPYKEIEALYMGMEGLEDDIDDEEFEEEEERPRRRKQTTRKPPKRTRKAQEEVDEDEDEVVDEEEEKPTRRTARTPRKPSRKAETGDESEDEEDEEKPTRRTTRTARKPARKESEDEVVDEEEEKPTRKSRASTTKDKCPHGHLFGEDTDQFNDCDKCKIWGDCADEKDSRK